MFSISNLSCDTVAILIAHLNDKDFRKDATIYGNLPEKAELRQMLANSGYLNHVIKGFPKQNEENSLIYCKKNKIVEPKLAQKARMIASRHTFGDEKKRITALQSTLIECMGNTRNHASQKGEKDELWWLLVYSHPNTKITSYSFIDTGVGIFNSLATASLRGYPKNQV
jgi:hypothetical protein